MSNEWVVQNWLWWNIFGPIIQVLTISVVLCIGFIVVSFVSIIIDKIKIKRGGDENTKKNKTR